jgi:hypothetical protein
MQDAKMIAAMAKSLRATLGRDAGGEPLTRNEARDIVELVELLATAVADLLERPVAPGSDPKPCRPKSSSSALRSLYERVRGHDDPVSPIAD